MVFVLWDYTQIDPQALDMGTNQAWACVCVCLWEAGICQASGWYNVFPPGDRCVSLAVSHTLTH